MADAQMLPVEKVKKEHLTLAQRQEILTRLNAGALERTLANEFGVSKRQHRVDYGQQGQSRQRRGLCAHQHAEKAQPGFP